MTSPPPPVPDIWESLLTALDYAGSELRHATLRAVLDHHSPQLYAPAAGRGEVEWVCYGDDSDCTDCADWPCSTIRAIACALGVDVPPSDDLWTGQAAQAQEATLRAAANLSTPTAPPPVDYDLTWTRPQSDDG